MGCTPSSTCRAQRTPNLELRHDAGDNFSQMGELRDASEFLRCCARLYHYFPIICDASIVSGGSGYVIGPGKILQMWSIMSTSKDQYVTMANVPDGKGSPVDVKANGLAADTSLIKMKFHRYKERPLQNNISFENSPDYYLNGIKTDQKVKAVQVSNRGGVKSIWKVYHVNIPNHYFAIGLIEDNETNAKLFLSSDGEGNIKLKPPNTSHFPVTKDLFIDPALLFRLVEP